MLRALDAAEPRPAVNDDRFRKKNYAERLSHHLASLFADALRDEFPMVTPSASGRQQESPVGAAGGTKRIDVKVWSDLLGLQLAISIKTITFRDWDSAKGSAGRYTKNMVRNDHELRAEASIVHRRQPYAVLIAVIFIPADSGDDAGPKPADWSSFAHAVAVFRKRSGRRDARDFEDLFERVYLGVFEVEGPERGRVGFFEVSQPPPQRSRPRPSMLIGLSELTAEIKRQVHLRNEVHPEWDPPDFEDPPAG